MNRIDCSKNLAMKIMMLSEDNKKTVLNVLETLKKSEKTKTKSN